MYPSELVSELPLFAVKTIWKTSGRPRAAFTLAVEVMYGPT